MRRLAITLLASTAMAAGFGQSAAAADLPLKAPHMGPIPVALPYDWSGFYVGAHVGAGWARKEWKDPAPGCDFIGGFDGFCLAPTNLGTHHAIGPLGGGQVGLNWQIAPFVVVGIEGQYSWANLKGDHHDAFSHSIDNFDVVDGFGTVASGHESTRFSTRIKGIATIAGRIGITGVPSDRTLFYVKGGAAYVDEDFAETINTSSSYTDLCTDVNQSIVSCGGGTRTTVRNHSASKSRWGWMFGAGLEFGLFDNWTAKVEYNYLGFDSKTVKLEGEACDHFSDGSSNCFASERDRDIRQDLQLIKFGINYRFGGKGPVPVAARY